MCIRDRSAGLGRCFAGQLQCSARSTGGAQVGERAFFAQGRTVRHADQCSQLHKGLIVVAGRIRRLVLHLSLIHIYWLAVFMPLLPTLG